jgi:four helix bundle protein
MKESILHIKSMEFAIKIVNLYKNLCENKKEYIISKQIMRSGTSIGANIREAQNAESPADFIHKLCISQKECNETRFWLELLIKTEYISNELFVELDNDAKYILNMLSKSIVTVKNKLKNEQK